MCWLCIPADPVEGDIRSNLDGQYPATFQTDMCGAPCVDPGCFCATIFCSCCTAFVLRKEVIHQDMTKYSCCQGYFDCCCFKAGNMSEQSCPECCLCLESFCCQSCAISATRMTIMDEKRLHSDPCDNRIIWCNNCMQCLACICNCLAMIDSSFGQCACIIERIADIIYCIVQACMQTQVHYEKVWEKNNNWNPSLIPAPQKQVMQDGAASSGGFQQGGAAQIRCGKCQQVMAIPPGMMSGAAVACPSCGQTNIIP